MARRRLSFEEMLMYQAAIGLMRQAGTPGYAIPCAEDALQAFWQSLPFPPTGAQQRVLR